METGIIKYIVYAVAMCIICVVMDRLHNRDNSSKNNGQDDIHYVVELPNTLKYVCMAVIVTGIILFIVFCVLYTKGNPTVNLGHIRLALIFMGIGIFAMAMAMKWRLNVDGNRIKLHRLFHKSMELEISEIERAEVGKKAQITLYKDGKKLVTIDGLADNYERFEKALKRNGKEQR